MKGGQTLKNGVKWSGYLVAVLCAIGTAIFTQYKDEKDFQERFDEAYDKRKAQEDKEKAK